MTHAMVKGSNIQLTTAAVRAALCWSTGSGVPDVDASALLLDSSDKVTCDEDFVFYNQPQHPSGVVSHLSKSQDADGMQDTLEADLTAMAPEVERVLIAASADGGTFADVPGLRLMLYYTADGADGAEGEPLLQFDIEPETGAETALVCGEIYRRGDGWKFRALGQGYDTGLAGLTTDYGVTVEEADADEEPPGDDTEDDGSGTQSDPPAPTDTAPDIPQPGTVAPDAATVPVSLPSRPPEPDFPLVPPAPATAAAPPPPPGAPAPIPGVSAPPAPHVPAPAAAAGPGPGAPPHHGYGYPQAPQQPPATQPAYGYPQPAYGYPQPDPNFTLPPQGPQFQAR